MVRAPSFTTSRLLCSCWKQPPVGSRSANRATSPSPSSAHYETAAYGSIGPATVGEQVGTSTTRTKESTKERRLGKYLGRLRLGRKGKSPKKCGAAETAGYMAADVYDYIDGDGIENVGGPRVHPSTSHEQRRGIRVGTSADTRYEYPIFSAVAATRPSANNHVQADEPLYTSASQIYSQLGSEDPYSSIVSDSRRNLAAPTLTHRQQPSNSAAFGVDTGENYSAVGSSLYADGGYARVREPAPLVRSGGELGTISPRGGRLNQLYSQINHQARRPQHPSLAAEINQNPQQRKRVDGSGEIRSPSLPPPAIPPRLLPPPASTITPRECGVVLFDGGGQAAESGSGSIVSRVSNGSGGSSRDPSYRYLTVRESVDVIRERIRRRDEEHRRLLSSTSQQRPPVLNDTLRIGVNTNTESHYYPRQPHYYSTIANEYESLGGGSTSGGYSLLYESVRQPALAEAHTNADGAGVENGPIPSINNGDSTTHSGVEAPAPPTSPIPSRLEPMTTMSGVRQPSTASPTVMKTTTLSRRPIVISPMTTQRISDPGASVFESRGRIHPAARFFHSVHPAQPVDLEPHHPQHTPDSEAVTAGLANNGRAPELPVTMTMTTSWTSTTEEGVSGSQAEAETQTPPPSRIPRPRLLMTMTRSRSSSPSATSIKSGGGGRSSCTRPTSLPFTTAATQTTTPLFNASLEGVGAGGGRNVAVNTGNFRLRRLEPPPSPHGNDYISRVDLGEDRSWPLS